MNRTEPPSVPDPTLGLRRGLLERAASHRLFDPLRGDGLRAKAMRGSVWTVLGYGGGQVLRLCSNLVLTRLLFPEAFGLMALVQVFMTGLQMLSDVGIKPSVVRSANGDNPLFLRTAWTIEVVRGLVLSVACWLLAPLAANFFAHPELTSMLRVTSVIPLLDSLRSVRLLSAARHLELDRITRWELARQALTIAATVSLAIWIPGAWALVYGMVVGAAFGVVLSYALLGGSASPAINSAFALEILRFGSWIYFSTLLQFAATSADRVVLGKLVPLDVLGIYSIALFVAQALGTLMTQLGHQIAGPAMASAFRDGEQRLREVYARMRVRYDAGAMLAFGAAFGLFPDVVRLLYSEAYEPAAEMVRPLLVLMAVMTLSTLSESVMFARGKSQYATLRGLVRVAFGVPTVWLVASKGLGDWLWLLPLAELPVLVATGYMPWRLGLLKVRHVLACFGLLAAVASLTTLLAAAVDKLAS